MNQSEINFFNNLAPSWDANEVRSTPERIKSILEKLPIDKGMNVLDLGTGTGVLIPYLSEIVGPEGQVTAIDLSEGMLSIAINKFGHLGNVEFLKLDFEEEQIPGIYDIALLYSVFPHLHAPADTLEWIFKINLKPGASVVIAFPSDEKFINNIHHERKSNSDHLPSAQMLAKRIREWGFESEVIADNEDEYIVIVRQGNL